MIRIHEFDPQIYPRKLWVCFNATKSGLESEFEIPYGDLSIPLENHKASTCLATKKDTTDKGVLVFTKYKHLVTVPVVAHESMHVADAFFQEFGMFTQSFDNQNEPYAYLVGWVAKCINEARIYKVEKKLAK